MADPFDDTQAQQDAGGTSAGAADPFDDTQRQAPAKGLLASMYGGANPAPPTDEQAALGEMGTIKPSTAPEEPSGKREVGFVESALRTAGSKAAAVPQYFDQFVKLPVAAWMDKANELTGSNDPTQLQDIVRNQVDALAKLREEHYELKPGEEELTFGGKMGSAVGQLTRDMTLAIISGGVGPATEVAATVPSAARAIVQAMGHGAKAMTAPALLNAADRYHEEIKAGVDETTAAKQAALTAAMTLAGGAGPMAVPASAATAAGRFAQRAVSSVPLTVAQGEVERTLSNKIYGEKYPQLQKDFSIEDTVAGALPMTVMAGAMGPRVERTPTRADMGYEAPAPAPEAGARVAPLAHEVEPAHDPVAEISKAATVDEAIAAADKAVDQPEVPSFAENADRRGALADELDRNAALAKLRPLEEAPRIEEQPGAAPPEEAVAPAEAPREPAPTTAAPLENQEPAFEDFKRRSDGQVKVFDSEKMAQLYQQQRSNGVPGNMEPRLTDEGWRLSREIAPRPEATQPNALDLARQPEVARPEPVEPAPTAAAAQPPIDTAPHPAVEIAQVADAVARGEKVAPETLARYPALAELAKAKEELAAARRQPAALPAERRADVSEVGTGRQVADVQQDIAEATQKSRVPINVVQSVKDIPFAVMPDTKGVYHEGKIWVVADNVKDTVDAQKTVVRHELLHAGFDALYGNDTRARESALKALMLKNSNVRDWASAWRLQYGDEFVKNARELGRTPEAAQREMILRSWEEGISHFAEASTPLNGWQRFVAVIQEGLRRMGLHELANSLEGVTNAEAQKTISEILRVTQEGPTGRITPPPSIQPAFSRAAVVRPGADERRLASGRLVTMVKDVAKSWVEDLQNFVTPMATGSDRARAVAKDYANAERLARAQWNRFDESLKKNFSRGELRKMWEAADEENVLRQDGKPTAGKGLDRLTPLQRRTVEHMHTYADNLLAQARDVGMFHGEGLPFWTPRMVANIGKDGEFLSEPRSIGGASSTPYSSPTGRNITTSASSLRHREHLTTEQTESAARAKFGDDAQVVKDIRTMPLAMARLERAIAGRQLINEIKAIGQKTGQDLISTSEAPGYFTVDHPAFKTYRPRFEEQDGKQVVMKDVVGNIVMDKTPVFVSKEFEGPLKAIMTDKPGPLYSALMALKSKSMSVIMYSPLIHNAVEWGRAMPLMPGKVATFRVYFEGNRARQDSETMREFISNGMVPIGKRFGNQDISGIVEEPNIAPGRSLTAKALAAPVGLVSKPAAEAVKRGVDTAGDFWHNTLLWDRIADLQAGIAVNMRDRLLADGMDRQTAVRLAAHFSNRFAGALPNEAMSAMARKIANLSFFSRTFTIGNMGVLKDMVTGLPKDVKAQILRDAGPVALAAATSAARKVAIHAYVLDLALMYAGNAALQSAFDYWKRDNSLDEIARGYVDRFNAMFAKVKESPTELLNLFDTVQSLSPTSENEPGKEDRVRFGTAADGTAIYIRLPTGKIGEEFQGWLTSPLEMLKRKESTLARPTIQMFANDKGFGRPVYDDTAKGIGGVTRRIGAIVWNYMSQQVPTDSIASLADLARGKGDDTSALKVIGPLLGVTFSKGAPGGPAVGELFAGEKEHRMEVARVIPEVKSLLKDDDIPGAVQVMQGAHMTNEEMELTIRYADNPEARLSEHRLQKFYEIATPERQERMTRALQSP